MYACYENFGSKTKKIACHKVLWRPLETSEMAVPMPSYYPAPFIVNRTWPGNMSRQPTPEARIYTT